MGARRFLRDLRLRRWRFRQAVGGIFAALLVVLAQPTRPWFAVGSGFCLLGLLVRAWPAGYIRKNKELETRGPYAFVRHPQYLGNCLLAVGLCLASGHPAALLAWAALFSLFYLPAIEREDGRLSKHFGPSWQQWRRRTPAVLPLRWPSTNPGLHLSDWSLKQCARNGEPVWMGLMLVALLSFYLRIV